MLVAVWPLVVTILGLALWVLADKPKPVEIGRLLFFIGMFWLVYGLAGKTLHIG